MRIAQVLTYVSVDGAFGGPVAVLRSQVQALIAAGHEVEVFAGWDGVADLDLPGAEVHLFRVRTLGQARFATMTSRPLLDALVARLDSIDVVHVHLGRHLLDLQAARAALRAGRRLVVQPHGMVMPDRRTPIRLLDAMMVRPVLRGAGAVLALTAREEAGLREVAGPGVEPVRIVNGVSERVDVPARVAPSGREVLFLARLHPRKRVLAFAEAARIAHYRDETLRFAVVGPDEGDLELLKRYVNEHALGSVLQYEGALPSGAGADRIAEAAVYVLPSRGEVFPMTVLEAASVGTPVVIAEDCAIASELAAAGAAVVVDGSPESIASAVSALLDDPERWRAVASNGRSLVRGRLSMAAVTTTLLSVYALPTNSASGAVEQQS